MKGYPKVIATKQDYENLLKMPEFAKRALADLEALAKDTAKVTVAVEPIDAKDMKSEWVTREIDNPMPTWKLKGFVSLKELNDLIAKGVSNG